MPSTLVSSESFTTGPEVTCESSTPALFEEHIKTALEIISKKQDEHKILFLRSWNEWAEGNYVEPDLKFGHGYLDALKESIGV